MKKKAKAKKNVGKHRYWSSKIKERPARPISLPLIQQFIDGIRQGCYMPEIETPLYKMAWPTGRRKEPQK